MVSGRSPHITGRAPILPQLLLLYRRDHSLFPSLPYPHHHLTRRVMPLLLITTSPPSPSSTPSSTFLPPFSFIRGLLPHSANISHPSHHLPLPPFILTTLPVYTYKGGPLTVDTISSRHAKIGVPWYIFSALILRFFASIHSKSSQFIRRRLHRLQFRLYRSLIQQELGPGCQGIQPCCQGI